jgi:DNA-binding beta-propeller fold protein YncE
MIRRSLVPAVALLATAVSAGAQGATQAPRFEVDPMWPMPMPNRWILGSATGVAVDARDHIFVVNLMDSFNERTESGSGTTPTNGECCTPAPAVLEFDAAGKLLAHWGGPGAGEWPGANAGLAVDDAGNVWIGGAGGQDTRIYKFGRDGKLIAAFGKGASFATPRGGAAADTAYAGVSPGRGGAAAAGRGGRGGGRGGPPALAANSGSMDAFGGAMGFAFDKSANEVFVADGSRNHRVAVIDATSGAIKRVFGAYGGKPDDAAMTYSPNGAPSKQFGAVRCVKIANDGTVYVCDSTNDRIQVFKKDGSFVKEGKVAPNTLGQGSVWDIAFSRDPGQKYVYVADGQNMKVHILDRETLTELSSFGDGGRQPGQFYAVHSIATDSKGNIYTTETYEGKRVQKFNYKGIAPVTKQNAGTVWPTKPGANQ